MYVEIEDDEVEKSRIPEIIQVKFRITCSALCNILLILLYYLVHRWCYVAYVMLLMLIACEMHRG